MYLLAHIGITVGAATLVSGTIASRPWGRQRQSSSNSARGNPSPKSHRPLAEITGLKALSEFLDIRLLILGSILPDILDKPLDFFGFGGGRSITHTLLITLIVLLIGLHLWVNYKKTWILAIAMGMVTHLILDSMWLTPQTLLWPLLGWTFPSPDHRIDLSQIGLWWSALFTNATVDIFEGIGLLLLLGMVGILMRERKLKSLLITGKI